MKNDMLGKLILVIVAQIVNTGRDVHANGKFNLQSKSNPLKIHF